MGFLFSPIACCPITAPTGRSPGSAPTRGWQAGLLSSAGSFLWSVVFRSSLDTGTNSVCDFRGSVVSRAAFQGEEAGPTPAVVLGLRPCSPRGAETVTRHQHSHPSPCSPSPQRRSCHLWTTELASSQTADVTESPQDSSAPAIPEPAHLLCAERPRAKLPTPRRRQGPGFPSLQRPREPGGEAPSLAGAVGFPSASRGCHSPPPVFHWGLLVSCKRRG